jgi:regulator of sigma D
MPYKSYHHRLHYRISTEEDLVQVYTDSAQEHTKWEIYNICRSIIFSLSSGNIISYSHPNLEYKNFDQALSNINEKLFKRFVTIMGNRCINNIVFSFYAAPYAAGCKL